MSLKFLSQIMKELGNFKEADNLLEEEHDPDLLF